MKEINRHNSVRGEFAYWLYREMERNPNIWLVVADLGYAMLDQIRRDFPERSINVGASEQSMLGIANGLALEGKRVFTYTITSFYLRAAETIALYQAGEGIPVQMVGSGVGRDYAHDGPSHWGSPAQEVLKTMGVETLYPEKDEVMETVKRMAESDKPLFVGLKR